MRAVFLSSRQPISVVEKWAASLQSSGASVRNVIAWSGADELGHGRHGNACNVDSFLLGPDATLESHLAQYCAGDGLLLVSLKPSPNSLPRSGVVLLLWQPQVPHDIVQACSALPPCLADGASVRGLLLVDPSPSLTLSVTHKALEGAGLHALARKPTVLATRTAQAPQALQQLADLLPPPLSVPLPPPQLSSGGVRIAVARDEAFGPCFQENLTLLQHNGAQLLFFSPLYDAAIPAGATCLYLSGGPLEHERWQQLAANRPLLAAVRAFCESGGLALAEGAGLLYLSRTVDMDEEEGGSKHRVLDLVGVLPFKARLLAEAQTAPVQLRVTGGHPLLPPGSRPRGYLSAQASIVLVEERQLQSLVLLGALHQGNGTTAGKATGASMSTTYEVTVVTRGPPQPGAGEAAATATAPEGYALLNVVASSCLVFLPSEPGLAAHWVRRCTGIDTAALAAGMAQHLSSSMAAAAAAAPKLHLPSSLAGSAAGSRAASRRQSIQDVSALAAAFASNGGGNASSSCGMLAGAGVHPLVHHPPHPPLHGAHQHHYPPQGSSPLAPFGAMCGNPPRPHSHLQHSGSATGVSNLGLTLQSQPQPLPRRSLCGFEARSPMAGVHCGGGPGYAPSRSPQPHVSSPAPSPPPPTHNGHSSLAPAICQDGAAEPPALPSQDWLSPKHHHQSHQQQQSRDQRMALGMSAYGSAMSISSYSTAASACTAQDAARRKLDIIDGPEAEAEAALADPDSPRWTRGTACTCAAAQGEAQAGCPKSGLKCPAVERSTPCVPARTPKAAGTHAGAAQAWGMPHAASAGSFTAHERVGSSCSLSEAPYQRPMSPTPQSFSPGYVGWGAGVGAAGTTPAGASTGLGFSPCIGPTNGPRHGSVVSMAALGAPPSAVGRGGVVCCAPGACEALVAMGLANRLAGIGSACDHPPDVCASRRVVLGWVPQEDAPQGPAARGIRVVMPGGGQNSGGAAAAATAGPLSLGLGVFAGGAGAGCRGARPSVERCGGGRSNSGGRRALLVDELALRREPPSVLVLPDPGELSDGELAQLEQALLETGLVGAGGRSSGGCCVLHASCRTLVDVMDFMLELGAALEEPEAASLLLERLQARTRRVALAAAAAAAAAVGGSSRLPTSLSVMPLAGASPAATPTSPRYPRVLVLQSLQPLVEPGRWVPEMLALVGATSCLAQPGGSDVALTWPDVRTRAAPEVIIILTSPGSGGADCGSGGGGGLTQGGSALREQLAALAAQSGWWCLPAVRVSQVYLVQASYFVRPGPRLVDGLEMLARLLLPGQYSSSRKVPPGAVLRLSLAAGQRCRATLLPSYFVPMQFH